MKYTPNYSLKKPERLVDFFSVENDNDNMEIIDAILKLLENGQTAQEILEKLKTVDGPDSGLNADLLDGQDSSYYASVEFVETELEPKFEQTNYGNIIAKSTSFTPSLADLNSVCTVSAAAVVTIPSNSTVTFPIGTAITFIRTGTGAVTLAPASGVTLLSKDSKRAIDGQYASATVVKTAENTWNLFGALA